MSNQLLLIEDEDGIRFGISRFLAAKGYEVCEAVNLREGRQYLEKSRFSAVICDYALPDGNALELLPHLRDIDDSMPIVVLTGHGSIELAVQAMQAGASQFLTKPVDLKALAFFLERLGESRRHRQRDAVVTSKENRGSIDPFAGGSPTMNRVREEARQALQSESPVLILGETGTGKGVLASWIHRNSIRAREAFVDLNCAGLGTELLESELFGHDKGAFTGAVVAKPGLLDLAHRGTLFLDEIGDLPAPVQPKLLKVLEEKKYRRLGDVRERKSDTRLVLATHHDLKTLVAAGAFRADLFYRINVITITLPSLRDRREDIPFLVSLLTPELAASVGRGIPRLTEGALQALQDYDWPGNVRELRNVLERAVLRLKDGDLIDATAFHLGAAIRPVNPVLQPRTLADVERKHVTEIFYFCGGDVQASAQHLGISRSSMYNLVKRYQLSSDGKVNL